MTYTESAILRIENEASAQLAKIARDLKKFAGTARSMQSQLGRLSAAQTQLAAGAGNAAFMGQAQALKRLSGATRPATAAITQLGTAYASAATKGQRFLTISGQITRQLQAQTAAAQAAKVAGPSIRQTRGNAVTATGTGRRKGGIHPHGYLHVPGTGVGLGLGGEMGLGKMLAITAAGGVVVKAAHVTLEGAKEGSAARGAFYQSGNDTTKPQLASAQAEFARRFGSSSADVTRAFSEVTPFSHDYTIQKALVEQIEAAKALARERGGSDKDTETQSLKNFKAFNLQGLLRPDANGKVDTKTFDTMASAIRAVQAIEGRNLSSGDFKNLITQLGGRAATLSTEGAQRLLLYGSGPTGSRAGTQQAGVDRLLNGVFGPGSGKQAIANAIKEGFAAKDGDGKIRAAGGKEYAEDPMKWLGRHGLERMKALGKDSTDKQHMIDYVAGLKFNSGVTRYIQQAMLQYQELNNEVANAAHARGSVKDAEGAAVRSNISATKAFENSIKSAGDALDQSEIGDAYRKLTNALTRGVNSIVLPGKGDGGAGNAKALGLGAAAVTIAGAVGTAIANNPTQSALTAAVTANTAAVMANTAAQGGGLLGKGVGAAASGGLGLVARAAGIGAAAAATAYMTYKGLGGGESKEANDKTREIAELNKQLSTLARVIETRQANGQDVSEQLRKQTAVAEKILAANEELARIRSGEAEKKDSDAPGSAKWIAQQQEAARRETERRAKDRPATGDMSELKAKVDSLKAEIQKREASIPGAGDSERKAVLGDLPQQLEKAQSDFNSVATKIQSAASQFGSTAGKVEAAGKTVESSMAAGAEKVAASGQTAGSAMQKAIEAGGVKAAATIGAAVKNVTVTVQGSPSRAPTGSATPARQ